MNETDTKALVISGSPKPGELIAFSPEGLDILRNHLAKDASPQEFALFVTVCKSTGLNPFAKQIYAIKRGGRMTIQTGIDGLRLIAQRTGEYAGQVGPLWCGTDGEWRDVWTDDVPPFAAKVGVLREGFREPLWAVARWKTYAQYFNGKLSETWAAMPDLMIAKCAEAQALRRAFPQELSYLHADEEMAHLDKRRQPRRPAAVVAESEPVETARTAQSPANGTDDPPSTEAQQKAIHTLLGKLRKDARSQYELVTALEPAVATSPTAFSTKRLTKAQASALIRALEDEHGQPADPGQQELPAE